MKKIGCSLLLCLVGVCLDPGAYRTAASIQSAWAGSSELLSAGPLVSDLTPVLGINLSSVCYYSSELVFSDTFKQAQTWQEVWDEADGDSPGLLLDANGWVEALAPGQGAEALLCRVDGHYPAGVYTCVYDGEGELAFDFDAEVISREPGRISLQIEPSASGFALRLMNTSFSDPLHNIQIYLPGFTPADSSVFHPDFLENWKNFKVIRFMDWMRTNNSLQEFWEDRPVPDMQTQGSTRGVALEYMIQLANELKAHPWFCMPHRASAEYILQFAEMVKAELNPDLKVYVEYSNEVWNAQFDQAAYCQDRGLEFDLSQDPYQAQLFYYSQRAKELFQIWEEVFQGTERLIRVLSGQFQNPWVSRQILSFEEAYQHADALAVAPYFGQSLGHPDTAGEVASKSVEWVLESCKQEIIDSQALMQEQAEIAEEYGLVLLAYEGGQHLVGFGGAENNQALTDLFIKVNRDSGMEELYDLQFDYWKAHGGSTYLAFASMGLYRKWGSWGLVEHRDQDPLTCPKYKACRQYILQNSPWAHILPAMCLLLSDSGSLRKSRKYTQ